MEAPHLPLSGMAEIRPVTLADAPAVAALLTAEHPDEPRGPEELASRWSEPEETYRAHRLLVEQDGAAIAFLFCGHPAQWPGGSERFGNIEAHLAPAAQTGAVYDPLLARAEAILHAAGAGRLEHRLREDDAFLEGAVVRHGYRRDRLSKAWELDLGAGSERLLELREAARRQMAGAGVSLVTLAAAEAPDKVRRYYELDIATTADIPHTVPFTMPSLAEFERQLRTQRDIQEDRIWTAWRGGDMVAVSFLRYPVSAGNVWTGYTACRRDQRGQGIARAVKLETLGQAIELGVPRVRTDNDEQNAVMLHINQTLGYRRIPGFLSFLK